MAERRTETDGQRMATAMTRKAVSRICSEDKRRDMAWIGHDGELNCFDMTGISTDLKGE